MFDKYEENRMDLRGVPDSGPENVPSPDEPEASEEVCDLCGMQAERLIPVVITGRSRTRKARICPECARVNQNCRILDESFRGDSAPDPGISVPESAYRPRIILLRETETGRNERIRALKGRRSAGPPVQEDLFLEDLANEKNLRDICALWESYEFDILYPELDDLLSQLAEKEKRIGAPAAVIRRVKEELRVLLAETETASPSRETWKGRAGE